MTTTLCEGSMLIHFDVKKPIKLFCDASAPMPSVAKQTSMQIEREVLAIIFSVRRFHQYLYGRGFALVTDHRPLCKILGEKEGIPPCSCEDATLGTCVKCMPIQC